LGKERTNENGKYILLPRGSEGGGVKGATMYRGKGRGTTRFIFFTKSLLRRGKHRERREKKRKTEIETFVWGKRENKIRPRKRSLKALLEKVRRPKQKESRLSSTTIRWGQGSGAARPPRWKRGVFVLDY